MKEPVLACYSMEEFELAIIPNAASFLETNHVHQSKNFMLEAFLSAIGICSKLLFQIFSSLVLLWILVEYSSVYIGSTRQLKAFRAKIHKTAYLLLIVLGHFQKILINCP